MTVKTRGIKLKKRLDLGDQGQQKLLQVTYSQVAAQMAQAHHTAAPPTRPTDDAQPPAAARHEDPSPAPPHSKTRRRALARMLRIELEATLDILDSALTRPAAT